MLGLTCILEDVGFNLPNLRETQIKVLKNAGARVHKAFDGVGFE